jgi:alpha-D-xyloside xylohydrolase
MRPLVMDFRQDTSALNQSFEYMFGKAFLVAPVTEPNVQDWSVYLPGTAPWYDFWTGKRFDGGQTIRTAAPLDKIPLFVRAGSVVPMGPFIQYSTESTDPIEIRIYPGANGEFTLYEDENDNYGYEKGLYSLITFQWSDAQRQLTIDTRKGSFPGMVKEHTFNIVVVQRNRGVGIESSAAMDRTVKYSGNKIVMDIQ